MDRLQGISGSWEHVIAKVQDVVTSLHSRAQQHTATLDGLLGTSYAAHVARECKENADFDLTKALAGFPQYTPAENGCCQHPSVIEFDISTALAEPRRRDVAEALGRGFADLEGSQSGHFVTESPSTCLAAKASDVDASVPLGFLRAAETDFLGAPLPAAEGYRDAQDAVTGLPALLRDQLAAKTDGLAGQMHAAEDPVVVHFAADVLPDLLWDQSIADADILGAQMPAAADAVFVHDAADVLPDLLRDQPTAEADILGAQIHAAADAVFFHDAADVLPDLVRDQPMVGTDGLEARAAENPVVVIEVVGDLLDLLGDVDHGVSRSPPVGISPGDSPGILQTTDGDHDSVEADTQSEPDEAEIMVRVEQWKEGKHLIALLATLHEVAPAGAWEPIALGEILDAAAVRKVYRSALLVVHPDKTREKVLGHHVTHAIRAAWSEYRK